MRKGGSEKDMVTTNQLLEIENISVLNHRATMSNSDGMSLDESDLALIDYSR